MHAFCSALLTLKLLALAAPPPIQQPQEPDPAAIRRKALHDAGIGSALTLLPVRVLGRPSAEVAEALGLVLEHYGMADLELGEPPFDAAAAEWDAVPKLLQRHVQQAAPSTAPPRRWLYAEYLGDRRSGPTEVRFMVVDGAGELVWTDRQTPDDAAFKRTAGRDPDPMGCSVLVAERLFQLAGWQKASGRGPEGKFAERWRRKSGMPDKAALAAMAKRREALRDNLPAASIAVLPTLALAAHDAASAQRLAALVGKELGCQASAVPDGAALTVAPTSNEQKRLWDLVAAVSAAVGKQPIDADYALVADIAVRPEGGAGFVHVVLVSKAGEVVVADFQNDQHPMFQAHSPKGVEDAEKLAVARLASLLR
jgi:hypothetical protein